MGRITKNLRVKRDSCGLQMSEILLPCSHTLCRLR